MKNSIISKSFLLVWLVSYLASNSQSIADEVYEFYHDSTFNEGFAPVRLISGGYALVNASGKIEVKFPNATDLSPPEGGMARVTIPEKKAHLLLDNWTFYNIASKKLIKFKCTHFYQFSEGRGVASSGLGGMSIYLIDEEGKRVTDTFMSAGYHFSEGLWVAHQFDQAHKYDQNLFLDRDGQVKATLPRHLQTDSKFSEGYIVARDYSAGESGKVVFLDRNGKIKFSNDSWTRAAGFSEGLARVKNDKGLYGFINRNGELELNYKWSYITRFAQGVAVFRVGQHPKQKWGAINKKGEVVVLPTWDNISSYSKEGLALARKEARQCFIDKKGKVAFWIKKGKAKPFRCGLARIEDGDKYYFVTTDGSVALENRASEKVDAAMDSKSK